MCVWSWIPTTLPEKSEHKGLLQGAPMFLERSQRPWGQEGEPSLLGTYPLMAGEVSVLQRPAPQCLPSTQETSTTISRYWV